MPAGVSISSTQASGATTFSGTTWMVGTLAAAAQETLTVVLTVGPATPGGTDVLGGTASVTSVNEQRLNVGDDMASVTTSVARGILVMGAGAGEVPLLQAFDVVTRAVKFSFLAYDAGFTGGVRVAAGDVNGDGFTDMITGTGPGSAPLIRVFDGQSGVLLRSFGANFLFDPKFSGGVFVAAGDTNGDGVADIVVSAGPGGLPEVKVFSGRDYGLPDNNTLMDFDAYAPTFQGGVTVAAGDTNGDGFADLITGTAVGAPHVQVFSGAGGAVLQSYFAYDPRFTGGVYVAADDVNGDGHADILTGAGVVERNRSAQIQVFDGRDGAVLRTYFSYDPLLLGGARVGSVDRNGDGRDDLVFGSGPTGGSEVRVLDAVTLASLDDFFASDVGFAGGVFVAGGR